MNQELELKAAKVSLKDKNNDPMVKNLSSLFQQFSLHLSDMQNVQKEMDKIFQLHKTTWDLQNLQNKLNLIENHQNMFSEEIFNSLHQRDNNHQPATAVVDKDRNNNSVTSSTAKSAKKQQPNEAPKKVESKSEIASGTLKRKRDVKSPSAKVTIESPSSDPTSRKQSQHTTATILVSKTKTKTGLPLLLKK